MVQFGREPGGSRTQPSRKPPPNYFSRSVQLRVMTLVFLFMVVLMLMFEARKPENWRWMWQLDKQQSTGHITAQQSPEDRADPQLPTGPELRTSPEEPQEPLITASSPRAASSDPLRDESSSGNSERARVDGWNYVLRRLSEDQRQLLHESLWYWRRDRSLTEGQQAAWPRLLARLNQNWGDYHARVQDSLTEEGELWTADQRRAAAAALEHSQTAWQAEQTALAEASSGSSLTDRSRQALDELQQTLDRRAWALVEDNTVLRSAESDAWYRCWEQLRSLDATAEATALGPLNYVQLFAQSDELRGQLVKVRGTLRRAYRVRSDEPRFGIAGYVVLGLLPGDNSGSPIAVYCVELPAGFPAVMGASQADGQTKLDEEIEVTGYYFKRWLHRSEGGMNLSPLLLGKITRWEPHDRLGRSPARTMLGSTLLLGTLVVAILAVLIAVAVYRSSRWSSAEASRTTRPPQVLPDFQRQQVRGSVSEVLRELGDGSPPDVPP